MRSPCQFKSCFRSLWSHNTGCVCKLSDSFLAQLQYPWKCSQTTLFKSNCTALWCLWAACFSVCDSLPPPYLLSPGPQIFENNLVSFKFIFTRQSGILVYEARKMNTHNEVDWNAYVMCKQNLFFLSLSLAWTCNEKKTLAPVSMWSWRSNFCCLFSVNEP